MRAFLIAAGLVLAATPSWAWVSTCGSPSTIARMMAVDFPVIAWGGEVEVSDPVLGQTVIKTVGLWNPESNNWIRVLMVSDDLSCVYDQGHANAPWGDAT